MRYLPLVMLSSLLGAVEVELDPGLFQVHIDDSAGYRVAASTIGDLQGDIQLRKQSGKTQYVFHVTYVEEHGHRSSEFNGNFLTSESKAISTTGILTFDAVSAPSHSISQTFVHPSKHAYARVLYVALNSTDPDTAVFPDGFTFKWIETNSK